MLIRFNETQAFWDYDISYMDIERDKEEFLFRVYMNESCGLVKTALRFDTMEQALGFMNEFCLGLVNESKPLFDCRELISEI